MILSLFNFLWIFLIAFAVGFGICQLLVRLRLLSESNVRLDLILLFGLAFLTAYAQWFSLFYRVGILATLSLGLGAGCIFLLFRRKISTFLCTVLHSQTLYRNLLIISGAVALFAFVASTPTQIYDTTLYHNQAIQWIEKYGVVKGLGNLHNRFAYNSSLFALQALFSWSTLVGQSLHGINSFFAILFACYAFIGMIDLTYHKQDSHYRYVELIFYFLILFQIGYSIQDISAPGTDFVPMLLILYIFSKWSKDSDYLPSMFFLSLFGLTVKLSIAALVIIGLPLLVKIIQKRQYKQILPYFFLGCFLVLPFLIRNIIISGYFLYPSTFLDFFHVDWKMPAYTVINDNHEIIAWGRRVSDVTKYEWPIQLWFPYWIGDMDLWQKLLLLSHILFLPFIFLQFVCTMISCIKTRIFPSDLTIMMGTSVLILLVWFCSSPLIRYGIVFLYLSPAFSIGYFLEHHPPVWKCPPVFCLSAIVLFLALVSPYLLKHEVIRVYNPSDYHSFACYSYNISPDIHIYYPVSGESTGYDTFPSTPYSGIFYALELRGSSLKDGFRIKEEYRNQNIINDGKIIP